MKGLTVIAVIMVMAIQVEAYTPVVFMNGGSYKCLDTVEKCALNGNFYTQHTASTKSNGFTPIFVLFGIVIIAMMTIAYKGRPKGWSINA